MELHVFITGYETLRNRLNKKQITDSYIENVAKALKVEYWDEDIYREVIQDLSLENPYKADISAQVISNKYYLKRRDKMSFEELEHKQCRYKLCDGTGIVWAKKKEKLLNYEIDYVFRCKCEMGHNNNYKIPLWSEEKADRGFIWNKDMVYIEDDEKKQYMTKKLVDQIGERF